MERGNTVNTNFYKIVVKFNTNFTENKSIVNWNNITFEVKDFNKINISDYFYLGSKDNLTNWKQINNIIDYIKFYKN